jgi:hypothetical protein
VEHETKSAPPNDSEQRPQQPPDRPVFLVVLAAGVLIICLGHTTTADLVADLAALSALYGTYRQT